MITHCISYRAVKVCRSGPCPRAMRYNSRNCCLDVAGTARSYEIIALNLMAVTPERGNYAIIQLLALIRFNFTLTLIVH